MKNLKALDKLTDSFQKLPGVGQKTAERMAYSILEMDEETINQFVEALQDAKKDIHKCPVCGLYTESELCDICSDNNRNSDVLIVVSYPKDVYAFERIGKFSGRYHVLNGVISASQGKTIDDLNLKSLFERIDKEHTKEIILATNPTVEGETTALYIAKILEKRKDLIITRLAYGLPMGGHLDYADSLTLDRALEGRRKI
jgi:recombination protein RecR